MRIVPWLIAFESIILTQSFLLSYNYIFNFFYLLIYINLYLFIYLFIFFRKNLTLIIPKRYTVIYIFYLVTECLINYYADLAKCIIFCFFSILKLQFHFCHISAILLLLSEINCVYVLCFLCFLGHDGCLWEINLRILWNHIMKNFQVKHGQCDTIIFPRTFLLKALSNY